VPVFTDKTETFQADTIIYNFKSGKGLVKGVVTEQQDGLVRSEVSKKMPDGTLYNARAIYTTCDLADPHFAIRASRLKMQPGKYVVSGPFNLEVNGIPTPLGFPLGVFPIPEKRTSGLIVPTYGESADRGYYLRDGGYYWAISDYVSLSLTGQVYTRGGWGLAADLPYKKRYAFGGSLNLSYNNTVRENQNTFEEEQTRDFWLRWTHAPVAKGTSRFSANVNAGTSSFNTNNSFNVQNYLSPTFNSNVSFTKTFPGSPFSLSANVRHNQNVQTGSVKVFPELGLSMARIFPLKSLTKNPKSPLALLNLSYRFSARMDLTNQGVGQRYSFRTVPDPNAPSPDSVYAFNISTLPFLLDNARYGARHSVPISTTMNVLKYVQFTPSFTYEEYWFPERKSYAWDEANRAVRVQRERGFYRAYDFGLNAGANTNLFLFYYFKSQKIKAIRQTVSPSVSMGYRPDFSDPRYDFYQEVQTDSTGRVQRLSRFAGGINTGPQGGESQSLSIRLESLLEMKVADNKDSTQTDKKIPLLRMSASYNVLADSFNLSNISFTTNARLLADKVSLTVNGTVDPYAYEGTYSEQTGQLLRQRRTPQMAWRSGQGLGRISNVNISLQSRLTSKGVTGGGNPLAQSTRAGQSAEEQLRADIAANPDRYVDFNVPWSLNFSYSLNYTRQGLNDPNIAQTLTFSGDVSITEKWKITFNSGYDFQQRDFTFTTIGIQRDLHCWQMSVDWVPFGFRQSYAIDISVKAPMLRDLKVSKRNVWFDR
jgi:hypothetical protein